MHRSAVSPRCEAFEKAKTDSGRDDFLTSAVTPAQTASQMKAYTRGRYTNSAKAHSYLQSGFH